VIFLPGHNFGFGDGKYVDKIDPALRAWDVLFVGFRLFQDCSRVVPIVSLFLIGLCEPGASIADLAVKKSISRWPGFTQIKAVHLHILQSWNKPEKNNSV
jgi:hypothetical protein